MSDDIERLYLRWRTLAEKGYGTKTQRFDLIRVDERIRKAKEAYENALRRKS